MSSTKHFPQASGPVPMIKYVRKKYETIPTRPDYRPTVCYLVVFTRSYSDSRYLRDK